MASGLYKLQASIPKNFIRCLKQSSDISNFNKPRWRTVTSLSFNIRYGDDPCVTEVETPSQTNRTVALQTLKQREKGDWRELTLEEKRALYHMSFRQPLCDVIDQPADEWKLILAGAFTAMGLMTLGMSVWLSQTKHAEEDVGPLSPKIELKDKEEISLFYGNELVKAS